MALTGHLSDLSLSELIEFFCNQRKTGQLKVLYPQGHGYFYLQTGSVVDARIGVLQGIDAVYYALTLPNAKFEFGSSSDAIERTINQPWTQVVLEGLRRLDEGVVPLQAFPADYAEDQDAKESTEGTSFTELEQLRVPSFLSFISKESMSKRRYVIAGVVTVVVLMTVAAIGVPAGWYGRTDVTAVSQPSTAATIIEPSTSTVAEVTQEEVAQPAESSEAANAAKHQRDKEKAKAREEARQDKTALLSSPAPSSPAAAPSNVVPETAKAGPKKITVTVMYDESGRVTQASGGDASAVRIARQKRFPAGKAGSATITIPVN
jgi:uncharacterized protein DUF4388